MKCYAVIDTNVIVSALLAKSETSATVLVVQQFLEGSVIPIYNDYILGDIQPFYIEKIWVRC